MCIFLYIYTVYALLFCIFSAYMQFNLKMNDKSFG